MRRVVLTGVGLVLDGAYRADYAGLMRSDDLAQRSNVMLMEQVDHAWINAKDRKVIGESDLAALKAASLAMEDAKLAANDEIPGIGCIVFNTGKGTRQQERSQARLQYPTADERPDTTAFARALERGEATVNPLTLLHDLDNVILWWLCRRYKIRQVNLQITQSVEPAETALLEAIEAIRFGECDICLVGGQQTVAQSAVRLAAADGRFVAEDGARVGGASAFCVLRAAAPGLGHYGELSVSPGVLQQARRAEPARNWGSPAIEPVLALLGVALGLSDATGQALLLERSDSERNLNILFTPMSP